jgi:hypothetical protein
MVAYPFKVKKGALHRQIGLPQSQPIPTATLKAILSRKNSHIGEKKITPLMRQRARFALNARKW